jgi:hypothetical protein
VRRRQLYRPDGVCGRRQRVRRRTPIARSVCKHYFHVAEALSIYVPHHVITLLRTVNTKNEYMYVVCMYIALLPTNDRPRGT